LEDQLGEENILVIIPDKHAVGPVGDEMDVQYKGSTDLSVNYVEIVIESALSSE
jgi:hypothetical protein